MIDETTAVSSSSSLPSSYCISYDDVIAASERIDGVVHRTPVLTSSSINKLASGRNIYFKVEALQKTGSFKFRGASNAIRSALEKQQRQQLAVNDLQTSNLHVVTHSSGNHAQALALAAKVASTPEVTVTATIVMPQNTPIVKKNAVADFGGNIVMVENTNEARESEAERIHNETGAVFIHPSEDPLVIAGQGTVCLELVQQCREIYNVQKLDVVIIPVGGGGLAAGNIISLRHLLGDTVTIVLAEPSKLNDAKRSLEAGQLLKHLPDNKLDSIADGLKTTLGPNTWPIIRDMVNDIITVSEEEILRATKVIWERLKICIEPSAGVGVAVALSSEFNTKYPPTKYNNIGIILCGGNVDIIKIATLMEQMKI